MSTEVMFGLMAAYAFVVGFTCYRKHQGRLVLFSNYTDIAVTFVVMAMSALCLSMLGSNTEPKSGLDIAITAGLCALDLALIAGYCKSTFCYNDNPVHSILSIFTKFSVSLLFIVLLIGAYTSTSGRMRGERQETYRRRDRAERAARVAVLTGIYTAFVIFSTKKRAFVSLPDYLSGRQAP
jgi:hypothetical protein